jgi:IS605 OrfB family transposase
MAMENNKEEKQYLSTICRIKPQNRNEFLALQHITASARAVYNMGLYTCRQYYFEHGTFLGYVDIYKIVKAEYPDYRTLHSQVAQQSLRRVQQDMNAFFQGSKEAKQSGRIVRIPKYKKGYTTTFFSKDSFKIIGRKARLSLSKSCKAFSSTDFLFLPLPPHLEGKKIKEIQIKPRDNGSWFQVCYQYIDERQPKQVAQKDGELRALSIDLGINNLLAMIDTVNNQPILVDGKELKSLNRFCNKKAAQLKSELKKSQGRYTSHRISSLFRKRSNQIRARFHKIAHGIVDYCLSHDINEICIGKNREWKQEVNLGKKTNQNFVQIPHALLIHYIRYRAVRHGISVHEQEESYTSKCDALSLEEINKHPDYLGRRTKRGIFRSSVGKTLNADINGAINILRKSKGDLASPWVRQLAHSGRVFRPRKLHFEGFGSLVLTEG